MTAIKTILIGATVSALLFFSWFVAFAIGQSEIKRSTVVRVESPYYHGTFFGECAWIGKPGEGGKQACATDRRYDELGRPL